MPFIDITQESFVLRERDHLSAFALIDEDGPSAQAIREINKACDHIWRAICLFKQEKEPVEIFIPRINNFNDEMWTESVVAILVAIAMPYITTSGYDYESQMEIRVGTTADAEMRILGWFIERIANAISPSYDPNRGKSVISAIIGRMSAREKLTAAIANSYGR